MSKLKNQSLLKRIFKSKENFEVLDNDEPTTPPSPKNELDVKEEIFSSKDDVIHEEKDTTENNSNNLLDKLTMYEKYLMLGLTERGWVGMGEALDIGIIAAMFCELILRKKVITYTHTTQQTNCFLVIDNSSTGELLLDGMLELLYSAPNTKDISINSWFKVLTGKKKMKTKTVSKNQTQIKAIPKIAEKIGGEMVKKDVMKFNKAINFFNLVAFGTLTVKDKTVKEELRQSLVDCLIYNEKITLHKWILICLCEITKCMGHVTKRVTKQERKAAAIKAARFCKAIPQNMEGVDEDKENSIEKRQIKDHIHIVLTELDRVVRNV